MRPGSGRMGTSGGPPGTGMRPGSGRARPPGTSRLRTGQVGTSAGTQAAQGVALAASINVTDRPMTGQGVMGMKTAGSGGRLVEDTSYYVGLLRKKINDVSRETNRLSGEIQAQTKESSQTTALEQKYEKLMKQKELLEGQLADYNLAMDKVRPLCSFCVLLKKTEYTNHFIFTFTLITNRPALPQTRTTYTPWPCTWRRRTDRRGRS